MQQKCRLLKQILKAMTSRHLGKGELDNLFDNNKLPDAVEKGIEIGVSDVSVVSLVVEEKKINNEDENAINNKFKNMLNAISNGKIWAIELDSDKMSRLLLDNDFFESYCDKKMNPFLLTKRFTLFFELDYSYWTENVYLDAFEND